MDVPKRIVDVFVAAAANVVNVSGQKGDCTIQICRTPAASAAAIVFVAAAALAPSTMRVVGLGQLANLNLLSLFRPQPY